VIDEVYLARDDVRADLLAATWAIVREWDKGGRKVPSSVYRGFETFSKIYGGMIEFAGYGTPMASTAGEINQDYADMLAIMERLAAGVTKRAEYEFHDLIEICRELNAFEWHLEGKVMKTKTKVGTDVLLGDQWEEQERFELTQGKKSWFGKLFSKTYGGSEWTLSDGRRVQFGKRGDNRQRRYTIQLLDTDGQPVA
jgi:hypothetical protein